MSEKNKLLHYRRTIGKLESIYHSIAVSHGLSDSAYSILYTMCFNGSGRSLIHDICIYSGMSKQTVNSSLRKLEKDGIVYLENIDGRSKEVVLTDKGRELCSKTVIRLLDAEDRLLGRWSDEDLALYIRLSDRFLSDLEKCFGEDL